jgi:5'-phosphate synthase pdxT subunit
VIPGGESTTMLKLLHSDGLMDALAEFGRHKPVFGTCAGAILMATEVWNPPQESLALMDIAVERNAYGRQIDSRVTVLDPEPEFQKRTAPGQLEAVFIRAPVIRRVNGGGQVLARYAGDPVLVEQGRHLVATFHPELTADSRVHARHLGRSKFDLVVKPDPARPQIPRSGFRPAENLIGRATACCSLAGYCPLVQFLTRLDTSTEPRPAAKFQVVSAL